MQATESRHLASTAEEIRSVQCDEVGVHYSEILCQAGSTLLPSWSVHASLPVILREDVD